MSSRKIFPSTGSPTSEDHSRSSGRLVRGGGAKYRRQKPEQPPDFACTGGVCCISRHYLISLRPCDFPIRALMQFTPVRSSGGRTCDSAMRFIIYDISATLPPAPPPCQSASIPQAPLFPSPRSSPPTLTRADLPTHRIPGGSSRWGRGHEFIHFPRHTLRTTCDFSMPVSPTP